MATQAAYYLVPCDYPPLPMFQVPESWAITYRIFVHLEAAVQHVVPEPRGVFMHARASVIVDISTCRVQHSSFTR